MWMPLCFSEDNHEGVAIGFCWPSLFKDAHIVCKSCDRCQRLGKLTLDYVSKWVKAIPCKHNDHRVVLKFLKENIFSRFGVPKAIISDKVYGKACHLPMELEYKAWWVIKQLNMDLSRAGNNSYINSKIAKEKLKRWHDQWIGSFTIHQVHSNEVVELLNSNSTESFKVNGHRLKPFVEPFSRDKEEFILLDPHQASQDQLLMDLVF
ncbi:hypothetical protein AAG906_037439 [Vitis piasezkii]